jgi:hypothetical protein
MRRVKKRRRSSPWMPMAKGPFEVGGVPVGRVAPPLASKRRGHGRLARKLGAAESKTSASASNQQPSAKSLARWENEGGRTAPPGKTAPDRAKNVDATHAKKKSMHSPTKEKLKPGTSRANR